MHATKRRFEPAVIERLFAGPQRFEYFQAVRMLELWLKRRGPSRHGVLADVLRFQNSTSLNFPASQIEAIHAEPPSAVRDPASLDYIRITPAFMGLLGGCGALPAHYTDRIAAHALYKKDDGPRAFLDAFSNRSLALFYAAWRKYRLELKYQVDGKDGFLALLLALGGMGHESLRQRLADAGHGAVRDESAAYFAAALRHRPASAVQIARVLAEYFGQPVRAEQFVGCWYEVPPAQQTVVGGANCVLGAGAMAGERVWQRDLRLCLHIGPLDHAGFNDFLPGGSAARALKSMLTMFSGVSLEYEVRLALRAADVQGATLAAARQGGRLGWDTYLVTEAQTEERCDVRYEIHAM
ncbi:MAG TPA: type VI secretion system baseplate subunit TssG [Telluria sp.]